MYLPGSLIVSHNVVCNAVSNQKRILGVISSPPFSYYQEVAHERAQDQSYSRALTQDFRNRNRVMAPSPGFAPGQRLCDYL